MPSWLTPLLAIIGALAWLPPLVSLILKLIRRPRLEVLSDNWAQIGFTELGPIFNPKLAFYAKNGSVLINRISAEVTHESGRRIDFEWQSIEERQMRMQMPEINNVLYVISDDAIGLNVTRDEMKVALIKMQSPDVIQKAEGVDRSYSEHLNHQKRVGKFELEEILTSKTTTDRIDFRKNNPSFEAGKYTVRLTVETRHSSIVDSELVEFEVTQEQVDSLAKNKENFPMLEKINLLRERYDKSEGWPQWSWQQVKIKKTANKALNWPPLRSAS